MPTGNAFQEHTILFELHESVVSVHAAECLPYLGQDPGPQPIVRPIRLVFGLKPLA